MAANLLEFDQATRLMDDAQQAADLAYVQPQRARDQALSVVHNPRSPAAARAVAERVLGQLANLFEDVGSARLHLSRAIRYAQQAGDRRSEAEARISRAYLLAQDGRFRAAFAELDLAEAELTGDERQMGRLHNQRGLIWLLKGGYEEALPHFGLAAELSTRADDEFNLTRILNNRGVLNGRLGCYAAAERDLERSEQLAVRLDLTFAVAAVRQTLGWVASQRGDVPAALARYDQAEREYQPHCEELGSLLLDRCEVLLSARLLVEARQSAERALAAFTEGRIATAIPEAELYLAESALLTGDGADATQYAERALRAFRQQRRPGWAALAQYAALRAQLIGEDVDETSARRQALRVATALETGGLHERALDVRIVAAQLGLATGAVAAARRELKAASTARSSGTVERRTRAWHAEALLRLADGDRTGARSALRAGLRILEEHRAMLGATDLRAAASAHRVEIARLGFDMAIADGRGREALDWVERSRAGLARLRGVRPPDDETLASALTQLRATLHEIDQALRAGERVVALRTRQARLERIIRDHCRSLPPAALTHPAAPPSLAQLARRLGERVLLEYVDHRGDLYVIAFSGGRAVVRNLGSSQRVEDAVRRLVMLLDRGARNLGGPQQRSDNADKLQAQARVLDDLVAAPLADLVAGADLVIAPAAPVRAAPWFMLPSLRDRAVTVVPSATVWFEAAEPSAESPGAVVLVGGPSLPDAEHEVSRLGRQYPHARRLVGAETTVAATLEALDGAALAHIAAHGTFRSDSPMFSSLLLADGPLTIYDLEEMKAAPHTVVLAACDSARHSSHPGDDLLGLASAFLSLGTRVLIAPLISLPDGASTTLMAELHTRMRSGQRPAAALAATQRAAASRGDQPAFAAASGFVCFGAG